MQYNYVAFSEFEKLNEEHCSKQFKVYRIEINIMC